MNETQKAKIQRFLEDSIMSQSVHSVLLDTFLKPKQGVDVQILAASRIAIDLLNEAWQVLEKYKKESENEKIEQEENVGL